MKDEDTTDHVRMRSQKRNSKGMKMMKWNGMRGLQWKWIRVRLIEVAEKKRERGMNGHE